METSRFAYKSFRLQVDSPTRNPVVSPRNEFAPL